MHEDLIKRLQKLRDDLDDIITEATEHSGPDDQEIDISNPLPEFEAKEDKMLAELEKGEE